MSNPQLGTEQGRPDGDGDDGVAGAADGRRVEPIPFRARQPVRWLAPKQMLRGAYGAFFGGLFSRYADNRDRIDLLRPAVYHSSSRRPVGSVAGGRVDPLPLGPDDDDAVVVDYVADVGDGFGATFAVASLLAEESVEVDGRRLRRGDVLMFGGDQVYPVADADDYHRRTVGPYALAFAEGGVPADRPTFAVPANHDWYDGLGAFLQVFTVAEPGGHPDVNGPWAPRQTRSYFAAVPRPGWWIWAIDIGLDGTGRISQEQTRYFRRAVDLLNGGDRIVLLVPEPVWLKRTRTSDDDGPDAWDRLVAFLGGLLGSDSWPSRIRLVLAGDKHYYARHEPDPVTPDPTTPVRQAPVGLTARSESAGPTLITAGGGGAYLSSTRDAPDTMRLERAASTGPTPTLDYSCRRRWPTAGRSTLLGWSGLVRTPLTNPEFNAVLSLLYGFFAYFSLSGWRRPSFAPSRSLALVLDRLAGDSVATAVATAASGPFRLASGWAFVALVVAAVVLVSRSLLRPVRGPAVAVVVVHTILQGVGLVAALILSTRLAWSTGASMGEVRWLPVLVLWALALGLMLVPLVWNAVLYRVTEWTQLVYFVPSLVVLSVLGLVAVTDPSSAVVGALSVVVAASLLGGVLGPLAFVSALAVGQYAGIGLNELFVGIRHTGYKHVLRIELFAEGPVVHVLGLRRTVPRTVVGRGRDVVATAPRWFPGLLGPSPVELIETVDLRRPVGVPAPAAADGGPGHGDGADGRRPQEAGIA